MELVIARNAVGEEIKFHSSEKSSFRECATELLDAFYEIKKKRRTNKMVRMIDELEKMVALLK